MYFMTLGNQTGHQLPSYCPGRTCHEHSHHRLLDRDRMSAAGGTARAFFGYDVPPSPAIGQDRRIAATSNSSVTFLLTTPGAAFQFTPQSLRLIARLPSKPTRKVPRGSVLAPVSLKSTVTGLVTPWMVRSPVTAKVVSPACSTLVEVKVMAGWLPVWMLFARIVSWALDFDGSSPSRWALPSNSPNCPGTLVAIVCRAMKPIRVWAVSRT